MKYRWHPIQDRRSQNTLKRGVREDRKGFQRSQGFARNSPPSEGEQTDFLSKQSRLRLIDSNFWTTGENQ